MRESTDQPTRLDLTVAANVRAELARRQIRQRALAQQLGRPPGWLNRRLVGGVAFTLGELAAVAEVLGISLSDLLALDAAA